jgi:hypothetical protein
MDTNKIVIYVVAFDPIKIYTDWAHQNDLQNLSFVKVGNVLGNDWKWSENVQFILCHFHFQSLFISPFYVIIYNSKT